MMSKLIRDWSLITGRGGGLRKGGGQKKFQPCGRGAQTSVYTVARSLSYIEGGGA